MNTLGEPLLYKESTESTMTDALEAHKSNYPPGTVCWTSYQKQGRGRIAGRIWHSEPGDSLMLTAILSGESLKMRPTLSLRIGLAVAIYLEQEHGLEVNIKWPNDIYCSGKKLCGILCEYRQGAVLAGLGLNLNQSSFPEDLPTAGSLSLLTGKKYQAKSILTPLLNQIEAILYNDLPLDEWNRRLLWRRKKVRVLEGDPLKKKYLRGILMGLNAEGALIIAPEEGKKTEKVIYSGELSI